MGKDVAITDVNHCECWDIAKKKEGGYIGKTFDYLKKLVESKIAQ
jgi:hypothetical protein